MSKTTRRSFLIIASSFIFFFESLFGRGRKSRTRVAIVIGHNEKKQGAYGNEGISEYEFNKKLLQEVVDELKGSKNEYKIFYRRDHNSYNLEEEAVHKEIEAWGGVDYAIEFHFNASDNLKVDGHEVLYLSKKGLHLAIKLKNKFNLYLLNNDRGIKHTKGRGYGFLKRGHYASIIAEPFFASHQHKFTSKFCRMRLKRAYKEFLNEL